MRTVVSDRTEMVRVILSSCLTWVILSRDVPLGQTGEGGLQNPVGEPGVGGDGVGHDILEDGERHALLAHPVLVRHDGDQDLRVVGKVRPGPGLGGQEHQGQGETDQGPHLVFCDTTG